MKYIPMHTLFLMAVLYISCKQKQTFPPPDIIRSETKDSVSSYGPTRMVRHVRQARNGDILIASYTGVWRYDARLNEEVGQRKFFTNITSAIKSPSFWDVLEDRNGNLWFASKDSGVYLLPSGQTAFQHFTTRQGLASNMALHIYEDRAGNIWFGASRYDAKSLLTGQTVFRTFSTKDGFPSNNIRLLLEDKTGKLWFGAQAENLFVYDARLNGEFGQGKTFTILKNNNGKPFTNVWGITEDRKGNIWFGATIIEDKRGDTSFISEGLWRYDPSAGLITDAGAFTKVSQKGAYAIIEDKNGNIWTTGTDEPPGIGQVWSLSRYDQKSLYDKKPIVTEIMSQQGMLLGILEDTKGSIWFGSGTGVYRYDAGLQDGQGKTITDFKSAAGRQ